METRIENGMVYVSVSDNGIGIASSTPDAIFEPYFTTRENGTGLAISRTIIETHGGTVTVKNGSPFGTRITFSLPVSQSKANIAGQSQNLHSRRTLPLLMRTSLLYDPR